MALDTTLLVGGLATVFTGPVGIAFSLTLLGAICMGSLRKYKTQRHYVPISETDEPKIPREQMIPVVQTDPDHIEKAAIMNRVSHLAVENDWATLASEIARWESELEATPGGARKHEIGADACLIGLQTLLDDAPRRTLSDLEKAECEALRFVERHKADPQNHILAVLAAKAHLMIARNCRADFWPEAEKSTAWRQMAHHYLRAETILMPLDPVAFMSPLLAGAYYELSQGMPDGGARMRPAFEDWIDLDPSNPRIYAAHMPFLIDTDADAVAIALEEAARADERTSETLGHAGYALCLLPVLDELDGLRGAMETDRFAAGLMDIASLSGTQSETNWAISTLADEIDVATGEAHNILQSALDALVRRNLTVIYPRLWSRDLEAIRACLREAFSRTGEPSISQSQLYAPPEAKAA